VRADRQIDATIKCITSLTCALQRNGVRATTQRGWRVELQFLSSSEYSLGGASSDLSLLTRGVRCCVQTGGNATWANSSWGAKRGANTHKHATTYGTSGRQSMQVGGLSSHVRQYQATARWCLLSSGSQVQVLPGARYLPISGGISASISATPSSTPRPHWSHRCAGRRTFPGRDSIEGSDTFDHGRVFFDGPGIITRLVTSVTPSRVLRRSRPLCSPGVGL
jgi:hypothetical protein